MARRIRSGDSPADPSGFTLVEMLIAMAITLVMMAAVATLFANVSASVRNRRATIEMSGQLRHVRNVLQQDLQGATCPGVTWQRPESNHGYIEIIEGQYKDSFPSQLTDGVTTTTPTPTNPPNAELDPKLSIIPRNNVIPDLNNNGRIDANEWEDYYQKEDSFKLGSGLGDYDDILMLTVRNENEPFVGRVPSATGVRVDETSENVQNPSLADINSVESFDKWDPTSFESPLAEVVWYAVENPEEASNANNFFGEPGMRTIYRRTLLIAPWINPYRYVDKQRPDGVDTFQIGGTGPVFKAQPGLVRLMAAGVSQEQAIAAIIAFQDEYDLSVRLEWDTNLGRWKILANTLGDLTKRENRFGHFGFFLGTGANNPSKRVFAYPMVSVGSGYTGTTQKVAFVGDPEVPRPSGSSDDAVATAYMQDISGLPGIVVSYGVDRDNYESPAGDSRRYNARPFAYVDDTSKGAVATANAMLNDSGEVVRVIHGPVPLWGTRRGEDVMMTDVLAFDLRVYDPGAPLYAVHEIPTDLTSPVQVILEPADAGWQIGYKADMNATNATIGDGGGFIGQGAYVDMGYAFPNLMPQVASGSSLAVPWFAENHALSDVRGNQLAPGYSVYDTWSFHYENNGRDDDGYSSGVDQGINGLDDNGNYVDRATGNPANWYIVQSTTPILGPDDVGERETAPPYDKPLRGAQVLVRVYERDSRAIRQVRVSQHFMPE